MTRLDPFRSVLPVENSCFPSGVIILMIRGTSSVHKHLKRWWLLIKACPAASPWPRDSVPLRTLAQRSCEIGLCPGSPASARGEEHRGAERGARGRLVFPNQPRFDSIGQPDLRGDFSCCLPLNETGGPLPKKRGFGSILAELGQSAGPRSAASFCLYSSDLFIK